MMGKTDNQMQLIVLDIDSMVPQNHLLRQIKNCVNFEFIYEKAAPYYSHTGRKSIDPVIMIKMLLIGYLYGIKSERRLEEEVSLNLAYRWFCELDLTQRVPDHSTFSQNRRRRFKDNTLFREMFNEIVIRCINKGIVTGETIVADGSFIPANISLKSSVEVIETIQQSSVHYLDELEKEMSEIPGYQSPTTKEITKRSLKSSTDSDYGIITGVDCFPANHRESDIILNHVKKQKETLPLHLKTIALDGGYDVGAVHRGLELLGLDGYTAIRVYQNNALKKGFEYDQQTDSFICENQNSLKFQRLIFKKSTLNYYRLYSCPRKLCSNCSKIHTCEIDRGSIRINASGNYPAFYRNKLKYQTAEYFRVMRLRKIWAEGTFSALKREHN